jgi:hypothetical protein
VAATEDRANPLAYATMIGIFRTALATRAIVVASKIIGINVRRTTVRPFPAKVMFIPPLVSNIPRQQTLSY